MASDSDRALARNTVPTRGGGQDRHLSAFLPYDRRPHHEDMLTRAPVIVMRAVPLARDALLPRIAPHSTRLPAGHDRQK